MLTKVEKKKAEQKHGLSSAKERDFVQVKTQHFDANSYLPSQSPDFLRSINFIGKRKVKLKDDASPTLNMALNGTREQMDTIKIRARGALSRLKVRTVIHNRIKISNLLHSNH